MNTATATPAQTAVPEPNAVPISQAQRRLWFIEQLQPGSGAYNLPIAWRLRGPLEQVAFERSLNEVVRRHASLRTTFRVRNVEPQQEITPFQAFAIPTVDLSSAPDLETEAQRHIDAEVRRPFDLEVGPLFRAKLLQLDQEDHIFIFNAHHIVWDGWSINVLRREMAALYQAFCRGEDSPLAELQVDYAETAAEQRAMSSGEDWKLHLDYWKEQLHLPLPVMSLPAARPRPEAPSFRGGVESCSLDCEVIALLRTFSRQHGATLFMALLAAFKGLLYRYTGQEDILVGSPVAGRDVTGSEDLIGFFVNTVALRTDLGGDPTFIELLLRIKQTTLGAYAHQDVPFDRVVQELHPERNLAYSDPLIQVVLGFESGGAHEWTMGTMRASVVEIETGVSKFDWTFLLEEIEGGVLGRLEYNTDVFEAETIKQFLRHFRILLEGIVENPARRISEFPLLTGSERRQILLDWNQTGTDYERDARIHELFERQAERTPEAIAVTFGKQSLTYRELNLRANQLAHYLEQFHIDADSPVGVCIDRSVEMVVGWLGILKAGGAYVPLDPAYPPDRLGFMLEDIQTPVLLTQRRLLPRLEVRRSTKGSQNSKGPKILCLDADWKAIARESEKSPSHPGSSENLAYVIFTSGSTGQPKGVAVPHQAVVRLVRNTNYIRLDSTDRIAQVANASFDAATFEIWGALLNGGRLVGIESDVALSPRDFARELREQGITAIFLTSALFNQVASQAPGAFETLRNVLVGGEAVDPKWMRRVLEDRPPGRLLNGYGPTENTTFTCCYVLDEAPKAGTNVPIGRPISNTQVYVLDVHLNPVPTGVPGKLYTGGDGLARGYWNRPELTAAKFVSNPFLNERPEEERPEWQRPDQPITTTQPARFSRQQYLYRTGDLVRYRPDGNIEFLGRLDEQVKLRGFRIELGEIEMILGQHSAVREAVVKICGKERGDGKLVAYFVPSGAQVPSASKLRSFLKEKLPDHMVPSFFVPLTALPLTPNGKLDRKALPEPDAARPELERKYASPRDEIESELARIWEDILGVHPIGIEDKFFDLGGHSLLAVRLIAEIEKAFGKKLRVATVFQRPTIEELAAVLREEIRERTESAGSALVTIQSKGTRPPLFLVHGAGGGMFWGYVNLARHLGANQPVYGFRARELDGHTGFGGIEEMAAGYLKDLRAVQPKGPYRLGGYCFGGNVAYEMARQLCAEGEEVAVLALMNCMPPNSRYNRGRWTPAWCARFLSNVWYWMSYIGQWSPAQRREFLRWKWEKLRKRAGALFGTASPQREDLDPGDLVDFSYFSADERNVWAAHVRALLDHRPKSYEGDVHLLRSPGHPLWCSFDADYGWGEFVRGAVSITVVPGAHEKILEDPCVKMVATELDKLLRADEGRWIPARTPCIEHNPSSSTTLYARKHGETAPLSVTQHRIWMLEQLEPGQPAHWQSVALRIKGELDAEVLEKSLNEIMLRHDILRTVFPLENEIPVQRIHPAGPSRQNTVDVGAFSEAKLSEIIRESRRSLPDLTREPPIRSTLVRWSAEDYSLLFLAHEILAGSDSVTLIIQELSRVYPAIRAGQQSPQVSLPIQYADFAVWQRRQSKSGAWDEHLAFWEKQLDGAGPLLDLPTDRSRPALQSYRAATEKRVLPQKLVQEIETISRAHGVNDTPVFLAAFEILLQRYSRQDDVLLGMPVTHRDRPELEGLVGNFANLLVLRTSLTGDPTCEELLARVQETMSAAFAHQEVPFGRLVEELRPVRAQSYHPLVQVLFHRHDPDLPPQVICNELEISPLEVDTKANKFDLSFHVRETGQGLTASIEYATDLFEAATIERMLGHWETLLSALVAEPNSQIFELPMLTQAEQQTVVMEWNRTDEEYPKNKTLPDLFETQVVRTPGAEALVCGDVRLTYRDLHARASRVAEQLRNLGVGHEALVGICLERSWEMVAGILGTLQAGCAYVPMDPAYPKDRLAFMLDDAKVRVLLTQRKLLDSIPKTEAQVLCVEDLNLASGLSCRSPVEAEPLPVQPQGLRAHSTDLAYVIYTSGSTGRPKGVAIEHRSAVALMCWAKEIFSAEELSGILASTSICFDLSVFEMFLPLSWGGKIILVDNLLALPGLAAAKEVTLINTVPSAIRELVRVKGVPESVGVINLAGEPLATSLVDEIYRETRVEKVYDLYGPTETTTYSTFTLRRSGEAATIGRPLSNEQIYLLDSHMQPVPTGVPGEIYIGGDGLARGYLGRPDLTAERFVPNPFPRGGRLYKTGDLARWRPDGNLEYIGRSDHQVKVRGFRIELGEIESVLKKQPAVGEAAVMVREDRPGEKRLIAYIAPNKTTEATEAELRRAIQAKLPEYMTPSFFVRLEKLPLTPNGKVDRKALPAPETDGGSSETFIAPRTEVEGQLAGIWKEVLGIKQAGINDDFFDLGGHSLLAVQAVARIRDLFKVNLPLMSLFDAPTIAILADGLASNRWGAVQNSVPPLEPVPRGGHLPLSFVQERLWFLDQLAPASDAYNVPCALRLKGLLDASALERALNEIIHRHEVLRTTLAFAGDNLSQVIAASLDLEIRAINLQNLQPQDRECRAQELVNEEAQRPFDLGRGPLLRASLIHLDETDHVFSIVLHHTIVDGWSLAVLFKELEVFYDAFTAGKEAPQLPPLPIQYADFAQWQRNSMQGTVLEAELAYWNKTLAGAPNRVDLPVDHAEPDKPGPLAAQQRLQLSETISNKIAEISQRQGATPFMVLMAALAITLHKWSGQKDLVIGTVVAGRNRGELEKLIGCFMNFLPIRSKLAGTETGDEVLAQMRAAILKAQDHQECPFEKMVEAINPQRALNQNPLYNVGLLLQNFPAEPFGGAGLRASIMPVSMRAALLDLRFEACQNSTGTEFTCEYRTDLFDQATIEHLLDSYCESLEMLLSEPQTRLRDFKLTAGLEAQGKAARARNERQTVAIASTFTAEPLEEPLRHWLSELEISASIEFAPYNQVFQQLLDPASLHATNQRGINVILLRLEDWQRTEGESPGASKAEEQIQRSFAEFVLALKAASARGFAPYLICLCPPSETVTADPELAAALARMEDGLRNELANLPGVYLATSGEMAEWYPVRDYYEPAGDELGHVPYTPLFFTSLATVITRKFHALLRPAYKVIVLDCDHTLWSGVCGEDGAKGIRLDPPYEALQRFMRAQHEAGMLLCLCSKNIEEDVEEVFAHRLDMPLRREHLISSRLNWQPKSENLKSLAEELQLGLESFIFVDDNPVECAEVEANCPEVLTLQLPENPARIPHFLKHCWAFDHFKQTAEDSRRTLMYQQNRQREQLRAKTLSLEEFISGLELEIQISPVSAEQLPRAAQLTQRTNQFNFTPRHRSESDLKKLLNNAEILVVGVSDRFGDYGLVGAMIFEAAASSLNVDTLLLSCRVLGRGVEHRMLRRLGEIARSRNLQWVDVHFTKTARNKPAHDFLESVGALFKQPQNGGFLFRFPAQFASELEFRPQTAAPPPAFGSEASLSGARSTSDLLAAPKFTRCRAIAMEADEASKIHHRMELSASLRAGKRGGYVAPRTDVERQLCDLWGKLLHLERVGIRDNFFDLGGHSLLAVRLFVEVEKITGRKFPLVTLFQASNVEQLARTVSERNSEAPHSLLVPIQPRGSKPPLFLVHGAGGDVLWGYANLAAHLPPDQPVFGIKSRGQAGLDEFTRLEEMAEYYLKEVRAFQPQGPYSLGGYCFGGNVAYEMARQLEASGERVSLLALLDSAPANAGYEKATWWHPRFLYGFTRNLFYWLDDFNHLTSQARRSFIARKLRTFGRKALHRLRGNSEPARLDLEDVIEASHFPENELKLWRVHLEALIAHVQQRYPGRVTLFRTRGQPFVCTFEEDFCWSKLATAGVTVKFVPGSHENVFMEPNVHSLASQLGASLAEPDLPRNSGAPLKNENH